MEAVYREPLMLARVKTKRIPGPIREVLRGRRSWYVVQGDALEVLTTLPSNLVHCVVTSPPYWGLRDYHLPPLIWGGQAGCEHIWAQHLAPAANGIVNTEMRGPTLSPNAATRRPTRLDFCSRCRAWRGCLGLEPWPELYVEHLLQVFRQVRRVLHPDGTLWLNLGDCYAGSGRGPSGRNGISNQELRQGFVGAPRKSSNIGSGAPTSWTT